MNWSIYVEEFLYNFIVAEESGFAPLRRRVGRVFAFGDI